MRNTPIDIWAELVSSGTTWNGWRWMSRHLSHLAHDIKGSVPSAPLTMRYVSLHDRHSRKHSNPLKPQLTPWDLTVLYLKKSYSDIPSMYCWYQSRRLSWFSTWWPGSSTRKWRPSFQNQAVGVIAWRLSLPWPCHSKARRKYALNEMSLLTPDPPCHFWDRFHITTPQLVI